MLQFEATVAARRFAVDFTLGTGETLAVLGPNGAGKSTLLNLIAGLLRPDSGRAQIDAVPLFRVARDERAHWTPPHARGVSLMTQQAHLFPHLSVLDNVAFGPRSRGIGKREARARANALLSLVDASEFARRRPTALSGGQAQRIAVARALASDPRLVLLDEPMAALDITVVPQLRRVLKNVLAKRTAIIVTHDVLDAYSLADVVAVMNDGRIVEIGPPGVVLQRPRSAFAAALVGLNLFSGFRTPDGLVTAVPPESADAPADADAPANAGAHAGADAHPRARAGAHADADAPGGCALEIAAHTDSRIAVGVRVAATVAPSAIRISRSRPDGGALNSLRRSISELEPRGEAVRLRLGGLLADVPARDVAELDLNPGDRVWASFAASDVSLYRADDAAVAPG